MKKIITALSVACLFVGASHAASAQQQSQRYGQLNAALNPIVSCKAEAHKQAIQCGLNAGGLDDAVNCAEQKRCALAKCDKEEVAGCSGGASGNGSQQAISSF